MNDRLITGAASKKLLLAMLRVAITALILSCAASSTVGTAGAFACRPIASVPLVIDAPGVYCLTADFSVSDSSAHAIVVSANDVTIDLRHHSLAGPGDRNGSGVGIYANGTRRLSIRNGTVSGFFYGIRIDRGTDGKGAADIRVRDVSLVRNSFRGIAIEADRARIQQAEIRDTGGTLLYPDAYAIGIEVIGNECRVVANRIINTYPVGVGEGVGISLSDNNRDCIVSRNVIENNELNWESRTIGIWISGDDRMVSVRKNHFARYTYALWGPGSDRQYANNVGVSIACTPGNFPAHLSGLPPSNALKGDRQGCYDTPIAREHQLDKNDARSIFRLALAYYESSCNDHARSKSCAYAWERALAMFERAAAMGLEEARRKLAAIRATGK